MISNEMARFLRPFNLRAVEAAWPKAHTQDNALATQAQANGLLSAKPIRAGWCRFQTTDAGAAALKEFDTARGGK